MLQYIWYASNLFQPYWSYYSQDYSWDWYRWFCHIMFLSSVKSSKVSSVHQSQDDWKLHIGAPRWNSRRLGLSPVEPLLKKVGWNIKLKEDGMEIHTPGRFLIFSCYKISYTNEFVTIREVGQWEKLFWVGQKHNFWRQVVDSQIWSPRHQLICWKKGISPTSKGCLMCSE